MAYKIIMTANQFVDKLRDIAQNYKTLYIKGCFGAPMTAKNKARYSKNNDYNKKRASMINAASEDTFGFDCVCLVKGVLWGWKGETNTNYGGAAYTSNSVPDIGTEQIIGECANVSTDFKNIVPGELLHMQGHVGVYIGDGLAVECTPTWKNNVQITAVKNIGTKSGYNARKWLNHGKLPWVDYSNAKEETPVPDKGTPTPKPTPTPNTTSTTIKVGDVVEIKHTDAKKPVTYYDGKKTIPDWVIKLKWIVKSIKGDRVVIDKSEDGKHAICSPIKAENLTICSEQKQETKPETGVFEPYLVKVNTSCLTIRKGAGTNYAATGTIKDKGIYTIVAEASGTGASKWGKLKSGAGWISLDYCKRYK